MLEAVVQCYRESKDEKKIYTYMPIVVNNIYKL